MAIQAAITRKVLGRKCQACNKGGSTTRFFLVYLHPRCATREPGRRLLRDAMTRYIQRELGGTK